MNEAQLFLKVSQPKPVESDIKVGEGEPVKVWLHPLTDSQTIHAISVYGEQMEILLKDGQGMDWAKNMATLAGNVQTLIYAVRVGEDPKSARVFKRGLEVLNVPVEERNKLIDLYNTSFEITPEEMGNLLRARTSTSTTK